MPLRTIRVVEMAGAIGKVRYIRAVISDNYRERCPVGTGPANIQTGTALMANILKLFSRKAGEPLDSLAVKSVRQHLSGDTQCGNVLTFFQPFF
ncbi:Uncharacterised protein [Salmonella enterica subsp. arizonae]|uniref:Uncharacterized protein n=1 Tax=Salmonella enterica subsp. arizonae TaxID=59203 RepID=A0A379T196_SALER|nr:Uncharacterised protein [Salmonella enterica subsp. arizonae]